MWSRCALAARVAITHQACRARSAAAVAASAGWNDSIASSSTVTAIGVPMTAGMLKNASSCWPVAQQRRSGAAPRSRRPGSRGVPRAAQPASRHRSQPSGGAAGLARGRATAPGWRCAAPCRPGAGSAAARSPAAQAARAPRLRSASPRSNFRRSAPTTGSPARPGTARARPGPAAVRRECGEKQWRGAKGAACHHCSPGCSSARSASAISPRC